jgi:hypothetical protein
VNAKQEQKGMSIRRQRTYVGTSDGYFPWREYTREIMMSLRDPVGCRGKSLEARKEIVSL